MEFTVTCGRWMHTDVKPISKELVTHAAYGIREVSELRAEGRVYNLYSLFADSHQICLDWGPRKWSFSGWSSGC